MTPGPREEELRLRLRAAADEHQPDRDAILARIERRRAESSSGRGPYRVEFSPGTYRPGRRGSRVGGFRPLAAAGALGAVVALGVSGAWLVGGFGTNEQPDAVSAPPPPPVTAAAPTEASGEPTGSEPTPSPASPSAASPSEQSASPRGSSSPRTSRPPKTSSPDQAIPDGSDPVRGWLWSDGSMDPNSNDHYAQSTVTLKNKTEMTALDVTIRVAQSSGVQTIGNWSTIAKDKLVISTREQSGWLYYRFQLRAGATIPPGSYTFAGQYDPGGKRSTGDDAYLASASAGSSDVQVHGGF